MDLFYMSKESFKNLLFDLLITGGTFLKSREEFVLFIKLFVANKDEDSEEYARTYYEALNQTLLTQKSWGSPRNIFYVLKAYDIP